jgi:two-component system alkaline phosphatase synthesis response regulator PhoP
MNSCDIAGLPLPRVLIIANERGQVDQLNAELAQRGFNCLLVPNTDGAIQQIAGQTPGVMLLDMDVATTGSEAWELAQRMRQELNIPLIALMAREELNRLDSNDGIDDFVTKPWETAEVAVRIRRVLRQRGGMESEDLIRCGDLVIDSARCEVSVGGKPIVLTFKEYQLLRFLATNREKVFTREALLNKVWGWDYYGGDRTVDVHIRRLRSKIEDSTHAFIETVRNIGYKFKDL